MQRLKILVLREDTRQIDYLDVFVNNAEYENAVYDYLPLSNFKKEKTSFDFIPITYQKSGQTYIVTIAQGIAFDPLKFSLPIFNFLTHVSDYKSISKNLFVNGQIDILDFEFNDEWYLKFLNI